MKQKILVGLTAVVLAMIPSGVAFAHSGEDHPGASADSHGSESFIANDRGGVTQHDLLPADAAAAAEPSVVPLAVDCSKSKLEPHNGFQDGNRCVSTAFGEVGIADNNPTLLITKAPHRVRPGRDFTISVSTRNLVRDRFLGAAAGGYYLETSLLDDNGLQRGHFHTACRVLTLGTKIAPEPDVVPQFFKATEDGKGSADPDTVVIGIPGKNAEGKPLFKRGDTVQCAAWAGDGSHRIPMMQRANETPAFDAVRIQVW